MSMAERRRLALAEPVRIHDGDQIIQFVKTRQRRGFPNRAFGDFAVAHQDVGVVIQLVEPRGAAPCPRRRPNPGRANRWPRPQTPGAASDGLRVRC